MLSPSGLRVFAVSTPARPFGSLAAGAWGHRAWVGPCCVVEPPGRATVGCVIDVRRADERYRGGDPETGIDLYLGQGGAPEGVLACAALKCVGGQFQGRLVFRNADERARARRAGIEDLDKTYDLHELVRADAIFAATGVTKGALLDGVRVENGFVHTHSLVMNSATHTVREVRMRRPL